MKPGQEIVVQVVKDPLKTKGARLSMELTIAGRYMVYAPYGEGVGVSRRLDDKERDRLRKEAAKLDLPWRWRDHPHGRAGRQASRTWSGSCSTCSSSMTCSRIASPRLPAPALVFQEADLSVRVVRDIFSADFERAIVDDPKQHHRLLSFFSRTAPDLVDRVELWEENEPLFEKFGIDEVLSSTLSRRIDLPSGGYLVIDYAEALTVIDVNTGSFVGRGKSARLEDTITKTNLEAADEVVRQLRLRDIGGIIVIDFIDMARARNRDAVLKTLRAALDEDRTKTFVVEISPLGLVEMTRQNVTDGVREIMTRPCPTCDGEGVIKSEETLAIEFERRMRDARSGTKAEALLIQMNPRVSSEFIRDDARALHAIETRPARCYVFEGSEGLPLDHFAVVLEGTREEALERAVPFRVGEEVHVAGRGAAHVQPRRRGRQGRRLHDLDHRRRPVRRREAPGADRRGGAHRRHCLAARRRRRGRPATRRRPPRRTGSRSGQVALEGSREARRDPAARTRERTASPQHRSAKGRGSKAKGSGSDAEDSSTADGKEPRPATRRPTEDGLQSKPRRRGRRGGRRRSGAKAESAQRRLIIRLSHVRDRQDRW